MAHGATSEKRKAELVDKLVGIARGKLPKTRAAEGGRFLSVFFNGMPPDDLAERSSENLCGAALSLWQLMQKRPPRSAEVSVFLPEQKKHGWSSDRAVIETVNNDMPFLVDSITAALNRRGFTVALAVHPVVTVVRDAKGCLTALPEAAAGEGKAIRESVMHFEIAEPVEPQAIEGLREELLSVFADVRAAVSDWQTMRGRMFEVIGGLAHAPESIRKSDLDETAAFLQWAHDDNYTFLGFRDYEFTRRGKKTTVKVNDKTALGVTREADKVIFDALRDGEELPAEVRHFVDQPEVLLIAKANMLSTVHRAVHMDVIMVKRYDDKGRVAGIRMFVGLFTSVAYSLSPRQIPVLRHKIRRCIERAGFPPASHDGKALAHILETYPRDELFQISEDDLFDIGLGILHLQDRQRIAVFVRTDPFERFASCQVYFPRDRYNTALRQRTGQILERAFGGSISAYYTTVGDSPLARVHFIVRTEPAGVPGYDVESLEAEIVEASRTWSDKLLDALMAAKGDRDGLKLHRRYGHAFPAGFAERFPAEAAVFDVQMVDAALTEDRMRLHLYVPAEHAGGPLRFKVYRPRESVTLSDVLPMLENLGFRVLDELPFRIESPDFGLVMLHDFGVAPTVGGAVDLAMVRANFHDAFRQVWNGVQENDGFNKLVVAAGLKAREVMILRAYYKFLRQAGVPFSQSYFEGALARNPGIAALLVRMFQAQFDPKLEGDREKKCEQLRGEVAEALDAVSSLDEDRILRSMLRLVGATLRTNYYQSGEGGGPKPYFSFKLHSPDIEDLPLPRPMAEIFVYSPRMEGVHLRGGMVARGGIRWSDRMEDFRTEILGLMKAQQVKNTVIVPVGAKGGFILKQPPVAGGREAMQQEGIACYRYLINGMLDLTDNTRGQKVVHPADTVRRDGPDTYIVAAADKGTATFSDLANSMSLERDYWLADAFASGGSNGYDHKKIAITSRGAWEAVKRHFRELGKDIQNEDFTCVGVGDMSGDVFGNGMLRSKHTRLLAAFNHLHIFVDPDPSDPARGFDERKRLFDMGRSTWADYDKRLLSKGGMIYERASKTIRLTPEIKVRFGLEKDVVAPSELMNAILRADVDLLWFGGIGTYVKSSDESHAEVGDRANDAIRVDGEDIRASVIGEGANLGCTQLGRIEYALAGGRNNTDALDNSGGVDASDHEVNIKILLNDAVAAGALGVQQRNDLLRKMTDEVAELVLRNNYQQSQVISLTQRIGPRELDNQARLIRFLERQGELNRSVEFLPDEEELQDRAAKGIGLTRPESVVVLSYAKIWLYKVLLDSDLPDEPALASDLVRYFPQPLRKDFGKFIERHRLRRELITNSVMNSMVNRVGATFVTRLMENTGMEPSEIARGYIIARDALALRPLWSEIEALDNKAPAQVQLDMLLATARAVEAGAMWFLRNVSSPLDIGGLVGEYGPGLKKVMGATGDVVPQETLAAIGARAKAFCDHGAPAPLAGAVAALELVTDCCDVVRIAGAEKLDVLAAARTYFSVGLRFGHEWLRQSARRLEPESHWQRMAVGAVLEDLSNQQRALAMEILRGNGAKGGDKAIDGWADRHRQSVTRAEQIVGELKNGKEGLDLAMLAVANRQLRTLVAN
ncbi:MAG: NAD-glutamate dehydrogenase [Acetobacterales bacterium]